MSKGILKLSKILGARLKAARETRGLSQADLSKMIGIMASNINHYENGRRLPSLPVIVDMADVLSISLDLLTGTGEAGTTLPKNMAELLGYAEKLEHRDLQTLITLAKQMAKIPKA